MYNAHLIKKKYCTKLSNTDTDTHLERVRTLQNPLESKGWDCPEHPCLLLNLLNDLYFLNKIN